MRRIEGAWLALAAALPALKLAGLLPVPWLWALLPYWLVPAVFSVIAALIAAAITLRALWLGLTELFRR